MADHDRKPDASIVGRDADAADRAHGRDVRLSSAPDLDADESETFDIIFEREEPATTH